VHDFDRPDALPVWSRLLRLLVGVSLPMF